MTAPTANASSSCTVPELVTTDAALHTSASISTNVQIQKRRPRCRGSAAVRGGAFAPSPGGGGLRDF